MKILVACEESQAVTKEFRALGHEAYSCDIIECSGGHPEWHIMGDVLNILNPQSGFPLGEGRGIEFFTKDGEYHKVFDKWDMIIAFPPCTHLAVSGARHFEKKRSDGRQREAIEFFMHILNADCDKVVVENPVNIISGNYIEKWFPDLSEKYGLPIKSTQCVQPYQFGHNAQKSTCLWLRGLPKLEPTDIVPFTDFVITGKDKKKYASNTAWFRDENGKTYSWKDPMTAKLRSKTFPGIAKAMATQWGGTQ